MAGKKRKGKKSNWARLQDCINNGLSDSEILETIRQGLAATRYRNYQENPDHATRLKYLDMVIQLKTDTGPDSEFHPGELDIKMSW